MRIEQTTDIQEILKCVPFENEIIKKGRDSSRIKDRLLFVQSQLGNPAFGYWMAYDDEDNVIGYTLAMLSIVPGMERLHLLRMYAPEAELREAFSEILRTWAKENHVKFAQITTTKNIKVLKRKYGFVVDSVNLVRRI